jgi:hypothetical protein
MILRTALGRYAVTKLIAATPRPVAPRVRDRCIYVLATRPFLWPKKAPVVDLAGGSRGVGVGLEPGGDSGEASEGAA